MKSQANVCYNEICVRRGPSFVIRVISVAFFLIFVVLSPVSAQTATYSDAWIVNNSGTEYDPATDEWQMPESLVGQIEVAAIGVTEADYASESETVETTLTSPDGRTSSLTSYTDPWYSRAETVLPIVRSEDPEEYQWTVNTVHSYWRDETNEPCFDGPCTLAKANHAAARPFWFFHRVFTVWFVRLGIARTAYTNPLWTNRGPFGLGPMGCRYRTRLCDSNCRNPTTWVTWPSQPCPPNASATYLTYRTPFVRACILIDAIARFSIPTCTPRTW